MGVSLGQPLAPNSALHAGNHQKVALPASLIGACLVALRWTLPKGGAAQQPIIQTKYYASLSSSGFNSRLLLIS